MAGWWWLEHEWIMPFHSVAKNHPNWLIFFKRVETTNNSIFIIHNHLDKDDEDCSIYVMDKWMILISYNFIS